MTELFTTADVLAIATRHSCGHPYPDHCDECSLRWPCETRDLCDDLIEAREQVNELKERLDVVNLSQRIERFLVGTLTVFALIVLLVTVCQHPRIAHAEPGDEIVSTITDIAHYRRVSSRGLIRILDCESRLDPLAVGDHGTSLGIAQLSSLPTGLLRHFYAQGYDNPFESVQAIDYISRVMSGEFAGEGVTLRRWSCYSKTL